MRKRTLIILAFCLLCAAARAQAPADSVSPLKAGLDSLVQRMMPRGGDVGIAVYDLDQGSSLYRYNADKNCRPASNMKLLTAIAALSLPGRDEPFRTELWIDGTLSDSTLVGDLYVVGGFDPELTEADMDDLVSAVASRPIRAITGNIYGDISMKDSLYFGSGWIWDDSPETYQPYLSPLMLNKGVVRVTARPRTAGQPAAIELSPSSTYYSVQNNTVSRSTRAGTFRLTRDWMHNSNRLIVSGNVASMRTKEINVYSSEDMFMQTFVDKLRQRGISCADSYSFREIDTSGGSQLIAVCQTPMADVLEQMMKESDNLNAEAMLYRTAAQSTGKKHVSADQGLDVVRGIITRLGLNPKDYRLADGCGLSMYDYVSPDLLVAFLRYAWQDGQILSHLYASLPIGGIDGTLKNRMRNGTPSYNNVHAKTGTVTAVSCLSGYLTARGGHHIAFSIMNQNQIESRDARRLQDALCDYIITHYSGSLSAAAAQ